MATNGEIGVFYRVYGQDGVMYGEYCVLEEAENKVNALEEEWLREGDDFENDFFKIEEYDVEFEGN